LFLELSIAGVFDPPINVANLRDPSKLSERKEETYVQKVLSVAQDLFPDVSHGELARNVFQEPSLSNKLRENIEKALIKRDSSVGIDRFFRPHIPEGSIVAPAILNRKNQKPELVAEEMDKLERGKDNKFTGSTDWIQNNFIGSLLQLYKPYKRACPFYAGFKTFRLLSRGNIRHFLELCYKSINRTISNGGYIGKPLSPNLQAEAARQTSTACSG
jgi:hypothetical protein